MKKLFLILFLLPLLGSAQYEFYNNGDSVYIQKGAMIHVEGTLTNTNRTGIMQNDGVIEVLGNFVNENGAQFGVFNDNTSTDRAVKFIGRGTQTIQGSMSTTGAASFYNLVLDVADTVEMQTPVTVEGSLVFGTATITPTYNPTSLYTDNGATGLLKTFNNSLGEFLLSIQNGDTGAIGGYPALTIGGAPNTGYILTEGLRGTANGGLQRNVTTASSYIYPIGTISHGYNAVSLNFDSIPAGGGSVMGKFCDGSSNPNGYVGEISLYCNDCPTSYEPDNTGYNQYFQNNICNGSYPQWLILDDVFQNYGYWSYASSNSGYKYEIEVFPNNYLSTGNPLGSWRTIKYESSYGSDPSTATTNWEPYIGNSVSDSTDLLTYTKNSGCYAGNGVPGGIYTDFSHFMMGESGGGAALPVEILYVNAEPVDNEYISVLWATAVEVNNAGFKVMRSTDGVSYNEIGWVDGHGNSTVQESYSYNDYNVIAGVVYYYQLEQVDNNGNSQQSQVVSAELTPVAEFSISDFIPNPAVSQTKLIINAPYSQNINVKIYDELGRTISSQTYNLTAGSNELDFDTQILAGATYTAIINTSSNVYSKKLVVVRK